MSPIRNFPKVGTRVVLLRGRERPQRWEDPIDSRYPLAKGRPSSPWVVTRGSQPSSCWVM
ncbi:hypothetical protein L484_008723 [Morus notabilis]|uniref:Uncharacterized protein n=1 Tax=Morus notabilis TaxID=981085 RepID=W9R6E2_9ROSA|nr:hypothetical protein L484_008723 [Morus notabilis]